MNRKPIDGEQVLIDHICNRVDEQTKLLEKEIKENPDTEITEEQIINFENLYRDNIKNKDFLKKITERLFKTNDIDFLKMINDLVSENANIGNLVRTLSLLVSKGYKTGEKLLCKAPVTEVAEGIAEASNLSKIEIGLELIKDLSNSEKFVKTFKTSFEKNISSKTTHTIAGLVFAGEVCYYAYRYWIKKEIDANQFFLAVGRSAVINCSNIVFGTIGSASFSAGLVAFGVTNPYGLVVGSVIGGIVFCLGSTYTIETIWEWLFGSRKEDNIKVLSSEKVYQKCLDKYNLKHVDYTNNPKAFKEKLEKKKKIYLKAFHPDKAETEEDKKDHEKEFIDYLYAYQIIKSRIDN